MADREHAAALRTLAAKLAKVMAGSLRFCYEAGPCGYGIQRQLSEARRMRRSRPVVRFRASPAIGSKPTDATRLTWPNCTERVNCRRCGFQTQPMRRSAIWCARLAAVRVLRQARRQPLRLSAAPWPSL